MAQPGIWWEFGGNLVGIWWNFGGNLVGIWWEFGGNLERVSEARVSAASYGAAGNLVGIWWDWLVFKTDNINILYIRIR
jgi:hypothetical protein